jgi:hypothetical protein
MPVGATARRGGIPSSASREPWRSVPLHPSAPPQTSLQTCRENSSRPFALSRLRTPPAMSDPRGRAAGPDRYGDEPHDLPLAEDANGEEAWQTPEKEAVAVSEGAAARSGDTTPDAEQESDDGEEGVGSPDQAEPNASGEGVPPVAATVEPDGIVSGAKVETNSEDAISHDADEEEEDDDDDSTQDASPIAEVNVEGESGAVHRLEVEPDPFLDGDASGTEEEQAAFMVELERFHKEHSLEFKPPKFYGKGLNCLKCASELNHSYSEIFRTVFCCLNALAPCLAVWCCYVGIQVMEAGRPPGRPRAGTADFVVTHALAAVDTTE